MPVQERLLFAVLVLLLAHYAPVLARPWRCNGAWEGNVPTEWSYSKHDGFVEFTAVMNETSVPSIPSIKVLHVVFDIRDGIYHSTSGLHILRFVGLYQPNAANFVLVDPITARYRNSSLYASFTNSTVANTVWRGVQDADFQYPRMVSEKCPFIAHITVTPDERDGQVVNGTIKSMDCNASIRIHANTDEVRKKRQQIFNFDTFATMMLLCHGFTVLVHSWGEWTPERARSISLFTIFIPFVFMLFLTLALLTVWVRTLSLGLWTSTSMFAGIFCLFAYAIWLIMLWDGVAIGLCVGTIVLVLFTYPFRNFVTFAVFFAFSYFVPQILQNKPRRLHPEFVVTHTLTLIAIPLYFWACPRNIFSVKPQLGKAAALLSWISAQVAILVVQYVRHERVRNYRHLGSEST